MGAKEDKDEIDDRGQARGIRLTHSTRGIGGGATNRLAGRIRGEAQGMAEEEARANLPDRLARQTDGTEGWGARQERLLGTTLPQRHAAPQCPQQPMQHPTK